MLAREIRFLLQHSAVYGLGSILTQLVSFLLLPLYTRYLTPADYGMLEAVELTSGLLNIVVTVGMTHALARFYYEGRDDSERKRVVSTAFLSYLLLAVAATPVLLALGGPCARLLIGTAEHAPLFRIGFVTLVLGGFTNLVVIYLRLVKRPVLFVAISLGRTVALVLLNVAFIVWLGLGVSGILYSSLIVTACSSAVLGAVLLHTVGLGFSREVSRDLFRFGLPLVLSNLGKSLVSQADKYYILALLSLPQLGLYSIALKFGMTIHNFITIPFNMAYIPRRFELMKQEGARALFARIFTYYIFVAASVGLLLSVFLPQVLELMVEPAFRAAGDLVPFVILSVVILGTHYHLDLGILYSKQTRYFAYINILCGGGQLLLGYLFVRSFGLWGAVATSFLAYLLQAVLLHVVSRKFYRVDYEFDRVLGCLGLALVAFLAARFLGGGSLAAVGVKCLVVVGYFVLLLRFLVTGKERARLLVLAAPLRRRLGALGLAG